MQGIYRHLKGGACQKKIENHWIKEKIMVLVMGWVGITYSLSLSLYSKVISPFLLQPQTEYKDGQHNCSSKVKPKCPDRPLVAGCSIDHNPHLLNVSRWVIFYSIALLLHSPSPPSSALLSLHHQSFSCKLHSLVSTVYKYRPPTSDTLPCCCRHIGQLDDGWAPPPTDHRTIEDLMSPPLSVGH